MSCSVFERSINLLVKVADYYYIQGFSQREIADILGVSVATISRLLSQARKNNIVSISLTPPYQECLALEQTLNERFRIKEIIVAPFDETIDHSEDASAGSSSMLIPVRTHEDHYTPFEAKRSVALEAARYLQSIVQDDSVIGISWGGTISMLVNFLNPCQMASTSVVTMCATISNFDFYQSSQKVALRLSNVFKGQCYILPYDTYQPSPERMEFTLKLPGTVQMLSLLDKIDISISGVGSLHPYLDSGFASPNFLPHAFYDEFINNEAVYGDLVNRFFDKDGNEIESPLSKLILGIDFKTYKKIPLKIVATAGAFKVDTILALLRGQLVDVLVIDQALARTLVSRSN